MSARMATWIAVPICLLNIGLAVFGLVFGMLNGYALLELLDEDAPGAILAISVSIVGALIASRRPKNPLGWIFCIIGLSQGLVTFSYEYAIYALITRPGTVWGGPLASWLGVWTWMPGLGLLLTFALLLFPDGRLPSPRWRVVALLSAIDLALIMPIATAAWPSRGRALLMDVELAFPVLFGIVFPLMLVCGLASVISLIVRFRRSQGIERQQLKWFTYAGVVTFASLIISEFVFSRTVGYGGLLVLPFVPSLPVAIGIAILRYRLWDIDLIVRRTLIYGALTALLALVYFGSVVLLQGVFRALTGQTSQLVIVASTLAIAALFNPLRRRVQDVIDRRFYRRKYDAAQTLAAFGAIVRDEVDLDRLTAELLRVVEETMQPAHVSLWLPHVPERERGSHGKDR